MAELRVTYDKVADAAYIYFTDPASIAPGMAASTYTCDPTKVPGMINLDFDRGGRLIGVEVLDARSKLPAHVLDQARRLDVEGR